MSDANANAWYGRLIGECLQQHNVQDVILCPGNRNAPLLFALKKIFADRARSHIDERSAAFMALGMAKASQRPVAVCMTSGTALANVLPALCEAHANHIPLIILSADRPDYLHDSGAPQCMQQQHIFKDFVADSIHLSCSRLDQEHVQLALLQLSNALTHCRSTVPAPIHVNITFDDPLPPQRDDAWQSPEDPIIEIFDKQINFPTQGLPDAIKQINNNSGCGLIVCGPEAPITSESLIQLAETTGYPVIADACSQLRHPDIPQLITQADLLCTNQHQNTKVDVIIRIGDAPLDRSVYEFCARQDCPIIRIDKHDVRKDFLHEHFTCIIQPSEACLKELANSLIPASSEWQASWLEAEKQTVTALNNFLEHAAWGECQAAANVCRHAAFQTLQVANSMAVRHANLFCPASEKHIVSYRGVSGIDGTIGSFIGLNLTVPSPSCLLCGDIAFGHDIAALHAAAQVQQPACICVINNNGGRIFDLLPVAACDGYEELMVTPQQAHIKDIAAAFSLPYAHAQNLDQLQHTLDIHSQTDQLSIIEIEVAADSLSTQMAKIKALIQ